MTLTDEQLKDGARLYEEARNSSIAFLHYDQWMQQFGPALFAMAERAARYDALIEDHDTCDQSFCPCGNSNCNLGDEIRAERDRAEQREEAKGGE